MLKSYLLIDNYDSFTYNLLQCLSAVAENFEVWRNDSFTIEDLHHFNPDKVLISPGPGRPQNSGQSPKVVGWCATNKVPLLGVCLGHQAIGEYFSVKLQKASRVVHGKTSWIEHDGKGLYQGLAPQIEVGRYHSLALNKESVPRELIITATTLDDGEVMGLRHRELPIHSVQFHPESILTPCGPQLLKNFIDA